MKKTFYILTFILIISTTYSQKEYHNWVFGNGCYISFNSDSGDPLFVDSLSVFVTENSSVISNSNGELQFFSYDKYLYSSDNELIKNNLDGNYSSRQGSCIFPVDENHYVRVGSNFSAEADLTEPVLSFIDIKIINGNTVLSEKKIIDNNFRSEGLLVIKNKLNCSTYLVVSNYDVNGTNSLFLYKYERDNFNLIQTLELIEDINYQYFKYNSNNNLIVAHNYETGSLNFYKFDEANERIEIIEKNSKFEFFTTSWSYEFSANGNYLYVLLSENGEMVIYRLTGLNKIESQELSYSKIVEDNILTRGDLLLGPNRKIYTQTKKLNSLASIENPDNDIINFRPQAVDLKNTSTRTSFPNIPTSFYIYPNSIDSLIVCENSSFYLNSYNYKCASNKKYIWSGPNGFKSNIQNPLIENANLNDSGTYIVTVYNSDSSINYTREIVVNVLEVEDPKIIVSPDSIVCNANEVKLSVVGIYDNFKWTTGETTLSITVTESGTYGVEHINDNGCVGYSEVNIKFGDDITTDIIGPTEICEGSGEIYSADRDYETYKWSNGDDTKTTLISEAGRYWLEVTTAEGCTISDTIDISYHPEITAELKPVPTIICEGDSVLLESKYDADYFEYLWNTGAIDKNIYASETGTYKLTITDTRTGCIDSTEIAVSVEDNLQPTIIGTNICEGETATLEALPNDPSYSYEWSNGETTPTIEVSQPATYTVTVSKDGCSGTAEFTVNESPNPEFEILGEDIVCGNSVTLSCSEDFSEYLWSTDEVTKEIEVTEPGTYTLTVTDENGCSATEEFTVNEQSLSFEISTNRIDFGKVYISETAIDSVTIINRSGIELTITDGTQNYFIPDGFPVEYTKTLNPTELGPYTDSFEYRVIEPCDTVITIPVTAEVYARVEISTEDIDTEIGKKETIPVYLECEADLSEQTYSITTDIDKTVLFTEDDYKFTQTAPINKAKTQIHEISGIIMLASELEYDITFPSYEFNNPYIEVIDRPGKILIDSVCVFPLRNVTFLESAEMKVSPNPARDRLVIVVTTGHFDKLNDQSNKSVAEPVEASGQQMQLELISSEGRVAYTENWTQTSAEKQLSINTDKIPSGLYQVRLQTPSGVLTENVIVVR